MRAVERDDPAYLDVGDVPFCGQVHPVRLVQLGSDHVVQVGDLVVLAHQGRYRIRQCVLAMFRKWSLRPSVTRPSFGGPQIPLTGEGKLTREAKF